MFRVVPSKPCFHFVILSSTGYNLPGKWRLDVRHKGDQLLRNHNRKRAALFDIDRYPQCGFFAVTSCRKWWTVKWLKKRWKTKCSVSCVVCTFLIIQHYYFYISCSLRNTHWSPPLILFVPPLPLSISYWVCWVLLFNWLLHEITSVDRWTVLD